MKQKKSTLNNGFGKHKLYQGHVNSTHSSLFQRISSPSKTIFSIELLQGRVTASENDIPPESISGFVTCLIDRKWWLACVLCLSPDESQVKLKLLHPPGPASSFKYPTSEPTITIAIKDVLTIVDPRTRTG